MNQVDFCSKTGRKSTKKILVGADWTVAEIWKPAFKVVKTRMDVSQINRKHSKWQ